MALDRNTIDNHRKLQGIAPLSDDEWAAMNGATEPKEGKEGQDPAAKPTEREITDEDVFRILSERTGKKITSYDDLKSPEEKNIEKEIEDRESAKLSWGLANKKINSKDYESHISASKDAKELVYKFRLQEALQDDPDLDESEFRTEFEEEFGLDYPTDSRRYKNGQKTLTNIADKILRSTYSSVYDLETEYSKFEENQKKQKELEAKIQAELPSYKKVVESVKNSLQKIKVQFDENNFEEVSGMDESIQDVAELLNEPSFVAKSISEGYTEESIKDIAWTIFLKNNFPALAKKIAEQVLYKKAAGTKGLLNIDGRQNSDNGNLTEQQIKLKNLIAESKESIPASN